MRELFWKYDSLFKIGIILFILVLGANLLVLNQEVREKAGSAVESSKQKVGQQLFAPPPEPATYTCEAECQRLIEERIARAVATLSGQPVGQTVVEKETVVKEVVKETTKPQTSYISVGTASSTTKTDWTDVKAGEVYIDPADYGGSPQVSWEASLKVAHANGKAFARLFDITHGIGVADSEISVENSAEYKQVSSGNLNLWSGRNQYRVQIKSLNGFEVFIDSARVKIVSR